MNDLAPCVFCAETSDLNIESLGQHGFYVSCGTCQADGPTKSSRDTAIASWNRAHLVCQNLRDRLAWLDRWRLSAINLSGAADGADFTSLLAHLKNLWTDYSELQNECDDRKVGKDNANITK